MSPTLEDRLSASLNHLAGRASASPDALDSIRRRYSRRRRARSRLTAAAGGALTLLITLAAVNVSGLGRDTEVSSTGRAPLGSEGESASGSDALLPAFISLRWLKPDHMGTYEAAPEERPDRWVQSNYRGDRGRNAQLTVTHNAPSTIEERAGEREGPREEVDGPRGTRVILVTDRGRYWGYWTEGDWQFEVDAGAIPSRDEALEILRSVTIHATEFEQMKIALRENVHVTRPGAPAVEHVVTEGTFEGAPDAGQFRITELASPAGQRCLGLEPQRGHRWFCLPSDTAAFAGEDPSIPPGPKVQVGDYWLYAALLETSMTVRVTTESPEGQRTVTLSPAPLRDGGMGVAVGFLPTSVESITTEFIDADRQITYRSTRSMSGG